MWVDDDRADTPSLGLKGGPDSLALLRAERTPAQFERADLEPADAGNASQLALRDTERFSAGSKVDHLPLLLRRQTSFVVSREVSGVSRESRETTREGLSVSIPTLQP